jgi:hypothetical protein
VIDEPSPSRDKGVSRDDDLLDYMAVLEYAVTGQRRSAKGMKKRHDRIASIRSGWLAGAPCLVGACAKFNGTAAGRWNPRGAGQHSDPIAAECAFQRHCEYGIDPTTSQWNFDHLKNHRAVARDSAGRIYQERRLLVPDDGEHESVITQTELSDPVTHELIICVPKEGACQVEAFTAPAFQPPRSAADSKPRAGESTLQDLGKQSINGVETVGTKETVVIESGKIGNDSPIEVQREYWYSPQLGVNLLSKLRDPRLGTQNFEVSDIVMSEPDGKLFKVSSKMKIIDLRTAAGSVATGEPKD